MRFATNNQTLTREQAEKLLRETRSKIAIDIETVSLTNPLPLGIALAIDGETGFYFFNPADPLLKEVIEVTACIILHNAAFDIPILRKLGIRVYHYEDTMLQAYAAGLLDKSLAALSVSELHKKCPSVTDQWTKKDQGNVGIDHKVMGLICIQHACNTFALHRTIPMTELYKDIDRPSIDLVIEMEKHGVLIDQFMLTEVEQETVVMANDMKAELLTELGNINLNSNPQVAKALQKLGILGTRKTKTGKDAVSVEALKPLNHPVTDMILDYRSEMKTLTTYVPAFRKVDNGGRLHTVFGYTNTGRWTSGDKKQDKPNLQNITRSDEKHSYGLRDCIVAAPGCTLVSFDASQIELRVVAILSQDPLLLEALKSDDLHMATAIQVFGWTDDKDLMAERRYDAKQLNFAILYGADEYKVAEMAGCSLMEAEVMIDKYFRTYHVLKAWIDATIAQARLDGFVTNMFGRIRPIPEINSSIYSIKAKGEREAINTIVQGTAVDIVKKMMLYLQSELGKVHLNVKLILQVHDEILWEVPDDDIGSILYIGEGLAQAFPDYPCSVKIGKVYGKMEGVNG